MLVDHLHTPRFYRQMPGMEATTCTVPTTTGYNTGGAGGTVTIPGFAPSGVTCASGYTGTVKYAACGKDGTAYTVSGCKATTGTTTAMTPAVSGVALSGFLCSGNERNSFNQVYMSQGTTVDGRSYYRGQSDPSVYIYYDKQCGRPEGPNMRPPGWIVSQPSQFNLSADKDLDGQPSGGCRNDLFFETSSMTVPLGTQTHGHAWCDSFQGGPMTITIISQARLYSSFVLI